MSTHVMFKILALMQSLRCTEQQRAGVIRCRDDFHCRVLPKYRLHCSMVRAVTIWRECAECILCGFSIVQTCCLDCHYVASISSTQECCSTKSSFVPKVIGVYVLIFPSLRLASELPRFVYSLGVRLLEDWIFYGRIVNCVIFVVNLGFLVLVQYVDRKREDCIFKYWGHMISAERQDTHWEYAGQTLFSRPVRFSQSQFSRLNLSSCQCIFHSFRFAVLPEMQTALDFIP